MLVRYMVREGGRERDKKEKEGVKIFIDREILFRIDIHPTDKYHAERSTNLITQSPHHASSSSPPPHA